MEALKIETHDPAYDSPFVVKPKPERNPWHVAAAVSGFISILFSTYEAHMYHPKESSFHEVYRRGTQLHLFYSLLLFVSPMARRPNVVGWLAVVGIFCFAGSCYAASLTENFAFAALAPVGGTCFMFAWLALAL